MSASNFPSAPLNPLLPHEDHKKSPPDEKQELFNKALDKACDCLFFELARGLAGGFPHKGQEQQTLIDQWQNCVALHDATPPNTRKQNPQLYYRFYAGDHYNLLDGPAGKEIDIPLNKAGKPIKFTPSTLLSKNCDYLRQYVKDKGYIPPGLCLLVFRQKQDWTYSIIITRDKNGPSLSDWD